MDFLPNEAQQELAALSRRILTDRVTPERLREVEAAGDRFDPALWADLASAGILAAALPDSLGGAGLGLLEQCSVLIEIGRTVAPVPYLASIVLGAGALARFGTPDQQHRWAGPAGRGELILTAALAEEDGDDPAAPRRRAADGEAERRGERGGGRGAGGGGWLLSGVKTAVLAAPRAGLMLVPAATPQGVTVFLVAPADGGVTRPAAARSPAATARPRLELAGVALPDDRVLGGPGAGAEITDWLVARARRAVRAAARRRGAGAGADRGVRAEPGAVRPADRQLPGGGPAPRRRLHRRRGGPADDVAGGLAAGRPACRATPRSPRPSSGPPTRATGSRTPPCTCTAAWASTPSYPLHRYFAAAKHNEFALGGATAQLRRIGAALARAD